MCIVFVLSLLGHFLLHSVYFTEKEGEEKERGKGGRGIGEGKEEERVIKRAFPLNLMSSSERSSLFCRQYSDCFLGAGENVRRKRSGEDEAAAERPDQVDDGVSSGNVTADVAVSFAQSTGNDVNLQCTDGNISKTL